MPAGGAASHPPPKLGGSPVDSRLRARGRSRAVATRFLGLLLLAACGGAGDELDGFDSEQLEQEQLDCRPVRFANCANAWNDRACFYVPPECATPTTATPDEG